MKMILDSIDAESFGGPVLALSDLTPEDDLAALDEHLGSELEALYSYAKVPLSDLTIIQGLEDRGFRMVETQIRSEVRLSEDFDLKPFPYRFELVETEEQLEPVLAIARRTFEHDRVTTDPMLGPAYAAPRYERYVRQSFVAPDQGVFRLVNTRSGETVAFKNHQLTPPDGVLFFLGGVRPELKASGLGMLNNQFHFNWLRERGVSRGVTHISAANHAVFNMEIGRMGFRVVETFAVLRKFYRIPSPPIARA
jgi:hypothetical protein